jgi:hypothetical protein
MHIATTSERAVAARIDGLGWGSLFVMTGLVMVVPGLPDGTWLVGFGAIVIAASLARAASGLGVDWLWVIVGAGALTAGAGAIVDLDLPVLALVLIACGGAIIAGPIVRRGAVR